MVKLRNDDVVWFAKCLSSRPLLLRDQGHDRALLGKLESEPPYLGFLNILCPSGKH